MFAYQDGPDFYIFADDADEDSEPMDVVNAPFSFKDGDMAEAEKAREWFLAQRPEVALT